MSTQTDPDRLREQVVDVLSLMTGASRVQLALWDDEADDWRLLADGGPGEGPERAVVVGAEQAVRRVMVGAEQAARRGLLPITAFRYAERTRRPLVVEDATTDDRFARDPYLRQLPRCSLLVVPILARGVPRAMLLLENHLTTAAFSHDRVDVTLMIAGQLALSLDNALAERFRSLVQRSTDLTLVCDRDGVISYASSAAVDLLRRPQSQLPGTRLTDLLDPADRGPIHGWLTHPDHADTPVARLGAATGDGGPRWVELSCTDLTADPAVGGLVIRLHDVTELGAALDLTHTGGTGGTGAVRVGQAGHQPAISDLLEEIPHALAETLEGADRVATIVKAMKAFGHPGPASKIEVDLNQAVRNTVTVARSEIRPVADVHLDLDPDLPGVLCNPADINQVILNLVINAAQAMAATLHETGRRGTLTVRIRTEPGPDAAAPGHVRIEVHDTGPGIPPEIADRVFDQFFTTKPLGQGTGQGLALAHALVHDHHGGTLTFSSTPGSGTTFTVRIPLQLSKIGP